MKEVLLQAKNTSFNPYTLNEMMINEMTKESINYGVKLDITDYDIDIISKKIKVYKAILKYRMS